MFPHVVVRVVEESGRPASRTKCRPHHGRVRAGYARRSRPPPDTPTPCGASAAPQPAAEPAAGLPAAVVPTIRPPPHQATPTATSAEGLANPVDPSPRYRPRAARPGSRSAKLVAHAPLRRRPRVEHPLAGGPRRERTEGLRGPIAPAWIVEHARPAMGAGRDPHPPPPASRRVSHRHDPRKPHPTLPPPIAPQHRRPTHPQRPDPLSPNPPRRPSSPPPQTGSTQSHPSHIHRPPPTRPSSRQTIVTGGRFGPTVWRKSRANRSWSAWARICAPPMRRLPRAALEHRRRPPQVRAEPPPPVGAGSRAAPGCERSCTTVSSKSAAPPTSAGVPDRDAPPGSNQRREVGADAAFVHRSVHASKAR